MSEETLAPFGIDERVNNPDFISVERYSELTGKARQTISYHINKGKLKPHLDKGEKLFEHDRQYYIHKDLVRLFPARVETIDIEDESPSVPTRDKSSPVEPPSLPISSEFESQLSTILSMLVEDRQLYRNQLEQKDAEIQRRDRELEARNTALVRYKETNGDLENGVNHLYPFSFGGSALS